MKIRLLSITHKVPDWIQAGFEEYAKRLPAFCALELIEIPAEKRTQHANIAQITERESQKMLAAIKVDHHVIALDEKGKLMTTMQLATEFSKWLESGRNVDLLIGGTDGLSEDCLKKANFHWSLSPLTFPHLLVRIIVAEQLYRAYTVLQKHPYHRA